MGGVVLHTSSPVLAALLALAERTGVSGAELMLAYAVGFEAGVRSGRTAPGHHKGGWHLTGTLGSIAAGVAGGKLLQLDAQRLSHAMGIAATQAAGMQQNRGTMCNSSMPARSLPTACRRAAGTTRLRQHPEIIEGKEGSPAPATLPSPSNSPPARPRLVTSNAITLCLRHVLHPLIDASSRCATATDRSIGRATSGVHPLVAWITGVVEPSTGL
jgi:hypothetical protein